MNKHFSPNMNRRSFIIGTTAVGAGLAIGFDLPFGGPAVVRAADGSPEIGAVVADFVARAKALNPRLAYCCDPVIGDRDRGLFVSRDLPPLVRDRLCPLADIVTPNHFEFEWLCGAKATTPGQVIAAAQALMARGPSVVIVTSAERAKDMKQRAVLIRGVVGRCSKPRLDMHYQHGPISRVAGYYAKDILWPNAGVGPEDIDAVGAYDAFTFTSMLQLEDYGFCKKGEGGPFIMDGRIALGGELPINTHGGLLSQGHVVGLNHVVELTRQLRREAGRAQVKDAEVGLVTGYGDMGDGSIAILRRAA